MGCMRTGASLLVAVLLVGPAAAQQPFDAKKYVVTLEIPNTGNLIEALATVDFVRRAGSDTLVLSLIDMNVDQVIQYDLFSDPVKHPNHRPFSYDGHVLRIPLSRASAPAG